MIETAMKLICCPRFRTPPVDRKFSYQLLATINLMTVCASVLCRFPSEPLDSHLSGRLCLLRAELLFLSPTRVPSRRHDLHQRPQVQSVGIVPYYRYTRLFAAYLGDVLLMLAVKYYGRTTDDIVFDEYVQIAVRLVEDSEEGVRRKFVEEIEQCQYRDAKFVCVKGSHMPRPLTRLRRSLIDKTTPTTFIRIRMHIDEFVCIMAVGDHWLSFLLLSVKPQGRNKMCIGLTVYPIGPTIVSIESFHNNVME